jgi:hypothetical protein
VYQQWLVDFFLHAHSWDIGGGQPVGNTQLLPHSAEPVG